MSAPADSGKIPSPAALDGFAARLQALELETMLDAGVALAGRLEPAELTRELLLRAVAVLDVNRALVLLAATASPEEPGEFPLRPAESFGLEALDPAAIEAFFQDQRLREALREGRAATLNAEPERCALLGCRKALLAPLCFRGEFLGVLLVGDKEGLREREPDFGEKDLRLLTGIAALAGTALANARLFQSVMEIKNYNERILASIASGVITTDRRGMVVSCNQAALRIFGLDPAQSLELPLEELLGTVGLPDAARRIELALRQGDAFQETSLHARGPGGDELVLNLGAAPLEAGDRTGAVISVENISEGARVKQMLRRYLSANVVDLVLERGQELALGGRLCEATILFADIRGFTALSEEREPAAVVELLNRYFELMIEVVFRFNGTVDKLVGDELMVLFGVPVAFEDDERRAVACAAAMHRALEDFNRERAALGEPPLAIGIGINRGPVISGNIGSTRQMDYTVIGDAVNLASRLVGHAGPGRTLISRGLYERLGGTVPCHRMENLRVKGKRDPVEVWEMLDE